MESAVEETIPAPPPKKANVPLPKRRPKANVLLDDKNIALVADNFGTIREHGGRSRRVKRFTWSNRNNVHVQVISYGARIMSLKLPDRDGRSADVALNYDDLAGCLYYEALPFGATIGRCTDKIENGTFAIDGKQYWLVRNDGDHHADGGCRGFDKVVWKSYVDGARVILTHVSPDGDQGYPGDLFVRVTYELTAKNEFRVDMEAIASKPTIVNLSTLLYLNLAGHYAGPQALYDHVVTVNANCYTKSKGDGLPNGKIMNVIYTKNDLMTPTLLKEVMGNVEVDGYDQNFCVNRGVEQNLCFVGRVLHARSGRIVEIYSNQCGVHFSTANHLGNGYIDIVNALGDSTLKIANSGTDPFDLINKLHERMRAAFVFDRCESYSQLRRLIRKLYRKSVEYEDFTGGDRRQTDMALDDFEAQEEEEPSLDDETASSKSDLFKDIQLTKLQKEYLELMESLSVRSATNYDEIKEIVARILKAADAAQNEETRSKASEEEEIGEEVEEESIESALIKKKPKGVNKSAAAAKTIVNAIPQYYKDGRIHGKGNVIYKKHSGLMLRTQNYPNAIYHKNFPSAVLRPGETYKHTTVYKFWIQGGIVKAHHFNKKRVKNDATDESAHCL